MEELKSLANDLIRESNAHFEELRSFYRFDKAYGFLVIIENNLIPVESVNEAIMLAKNKFYCSWKDEYAFHLVMSSANKPVILPCTKAIYDYVNDNDKIDTSGFLIIKDRIGFEHELIRME